LLQINLKKNLPTIFLRLLVGFFFVISAILKLDVMDSFEIYIFSFGWFNLNNSFLFARLIISLELLIGVSILIGAFTKQISLLSIFVLLFFTVFIGYLYFSGNEEHCHCFGDKIELSHVTSIVKNIFLIVALLLIYKKSTFKIRFQKFIFVISLLICFVLPVSLSPPDSFYFKTEKKLTNYNSEYLQEFLDQNSSLQEGKRIISFFGTSCRYCKLATKKIKVIIEKSNQKNLFSYVFWGSENSIQKFIDKTNSANLAYKILEGTRFLKITNGKLPLILVLENGKVKDSFGYRDINDNKIIEFIKKEE